MNRLRLANLALSLAALPGALAARAQAPDQLYTATHQQLDVAKVVLAQERAWNKGDLDGYLAAYKDAPDTEALLGNPCRGLPNIRAAFRANFPSHEAMGTLEQSNVEVHALGETFALATGKYHLARAHKSGGDTDGTFIEVLEKTSAGWQVVFSQTT